MKVPGLRHSSERVGGIVFLGRMLDKIRLQAKNALPADYKTNLGAGSDGRVCQFLRVEYPAVVERVLAGGTDEEILSWCFDHGRRPTEEEIFIFNAFLTKGFIPLFGAMVFAAAFVCLYGRRGIMSLLLAVI